MNTLKQRRGWHRERWTGETDRERHFLGRGVSGAEAAWSGGLPLGPCLDAVRERRDDGAGGFLEEAASNRGLTVRMGGHGHSLPRPLAAHLGW